MKKQLKTWFHKHPMFYALFKDNTYRTLTAPLRTVPNFIIIGEQKCGTTSLYDNLVQHPSIISASRKEVHFFDNDYHYAGGLNRYKIQFPTIFYKNYIKKIHNNEFLTGESSPNHLMHPLIPKRVFENLPNVKLIVILRNPVDRAFSQYQMACRKGKENLSFEDALDYEVNAFDGDQKKIDWEMKYRTFNGGHWPYLKRGKYVDGLKRWMDVFPREQFLILMMEEFEKNPRKILKKTFEFLGISDFEVEQIEKSNVGEYQDMKEDTRKFLIDYYKPQNQLLYDFLGSKFDWDR